MRYIMLNLIFATVFTAMIGYFVALALGTFGIVLGQTLYRLCAMGLWVSIFIYLSLDEVKTT